MNNENPSATVKPGLSLVMLVHEPATQVAEIIRLFEGTVDEVVVAVDSRSSIQARLGPGGCYGYTCAGRT